jgi:DnaJ family protein C protein 17
MEREEQLRKEMARTDISQKDSEVVNNAASNVFQHASQSTAQGPLPKGGTSVPEIQRTVKVRWLREGWGKILDKEKFSAMFSTLGKIESAVILKDRKVRMGDAKRKQLVGNGVVVFKSIVGAHAAVEDAKKMKDGGWDVIESVEWAEGKEPDILPSASVPAPQFSNGHTEDTPETSTPKKPSNDAKRQFPGLDSQPSTPVSVKANTANAEPGLRKVPSFASFKSGAFNTPASSPFAKSVGSPSLEEITMIRLKNMEKKRLEDKIRREEAEAAARDAEKEAGGAL